MQGGEACTPGLPLPHGRSAFVSRQACHAGLLRRADALVGAAGCGAACKSRATLGASGKGGSRRTFCPSGAAAYLIPFSRTTTVPDDASPSPRQSPLGTAASAAPSCGRAASCCGCWRCAPPSAASPPSSPSSSPAAAAASAPWGAQPSSRSMSRAGRQMMLLRPVCRCRHSLMPSRCRSTQAAAARRAWECKYSNISTQAAACLWLLACECCAAGALLPQDEPHTSSTDPPHTRTRRELRAPETSRHRCLSSACAAAT